MTDGSVKSKEPRIPAGAPEWVTSDMIDRAIRICQPRYTVPLSREDGLEIVLSIGHLLDAVQELAA